MHAFPPLDFHCILLSYNSAVDISVGDPVVTLGAEHEWRDGLCWTSQCQSQMDILAAEPHNVSHKWTIWDKLWKSLGCSLEKLSRGSSRGRSPRDGFSRLHKAFPQLVRLY